MQKNFIEKLVELFVKFWYKIPRYKIKLSIDRKHVDDRSFDWYLCRKNFGFDERVLWNLSGNLDDRIRKALAIDRREHNISLEEFKLWINHIAIQQDLIWFYRRVDKYIEWECPYSFYKDGTFLTQPEIDDVLKIYKTYLDDIIQCLPMDEEDRELSYKPRIPSDDKIEFIYKYDRFGY